MKKLLFIIPFIIAVLTGKTFAGDSDLADFMVELNEEISAAETYSFPEIKPEICIFGGYRSANVSGSERAGEFEYLHDSITAGGNIVFTSYPHRFHFDLDIRNRKDHFGDVRYAYKDIVFFRSMDSTLFHNIENIDLDPSGSATGVDIRDKGEDYGVEFGMRSIFLRLKTPDFPLHFYIRGTLRKKEGSVQQRSLLGSAYFNNRLKTSDSREIDWKTKDLVIGTNSHLGPVEIDISHGEKRFDAGRDDVMYDTYSSAGFGPPGALRFGGTFPHNLIPDLKSSSNTLKLHTSYTGKLVASATISKIDKDNRESGADADYFIGSGGITWMPLTKLTFFLKYMHKDADIDNPDTVATASLCSPSNNNAGTYSCIIRPSISSKTDTFTGTVRYRLLSNLTLKAGYSFKDIDRDDYEDWELPASTQKNTLNLSADIKIVKGLKMKVRYIHKSINNPAYNIEPDDSDEGRISITWMPLPRLNTMLSYSHTREKRGNLHFIDTEEAENRDVKRHSLTGTVTVLALKNLSMTTSFSYFSNRTAQDIEYHDETGVPHIDTFVPYRDEARNYTFDIIYMPKNNLDLSAGVSHTNSRGSYSPSDINLLEPISVDSLSRLRIKETTYTASGQYRFRGGFASGVQYRYTDYNDVADNPNDDVDDAHAQIILLTFSKKW